MNINMLQLNQVKSIHSEIDQVNTDRRNGDHSEHKRDPLKSKGFIGLFMNDDREQRYAREVQKVAQHEGEDVPDVVVVFYVESNLRAEN